MARVTTPVLHHRHTADKFLLIRPFSRGIFSGYFWNFDWNNSDGLLNLSLSANQRLDHDKPARFNLLIAYYKIK